MFFTYIYISTKYKYMVQNDWVAGLRFGSFMLSGKSYFDSIQRKRYVEVLCDCGTIKWVRWDSIKRGFSTSCGCIVKERLKRDKPASTHGLSDNPIYTIYKRMMERCYDKKHKGAKSYELVNVCDEWKNSFVCFYEWAKDKWVEGLELDKDILYSEKHGTKTGILYSPEYCCFVTGKENCRNTSRSRYITHNGETKTLIEWAEYLGMRDSTLGERLNRYGWAIEKALTTPLKLHKRLTP